IEFAEAQQRRTHVTVRIDGEQRCGKARFVRERRTVEQRAHIGGPFIEHVLFKWTRRGGRGSRGIAHTVDPVDETGKAQSCLENSKARIGGPLLSSCRCAVVARSLHKRAAVLSPIHRQSIAGSAKEHMLRDLREWVM